MSEEGKTTFFWTGNSNPFPHISSLSFFQTFKATKIIYHDYRVAVESGLVPVLKSTQKNRKGSIKSLEIAVLIVIIPLFIAAVMISVLMGFLSDLAIIQAYSFPQQMIQTVLSYQAFLDGVVLLAFAAIVGRIFVKSFRINMHPVLGVVGILALPALVITLAQASNIVGVFANLSIVGSSVNQFPASFTLFQNLPLVGSAMALLILIVMVGVGRRR